MVNLGHWDDGTPEKVWAASDWRAGLPALPIDDLRRLIVVAAHPDDETLGAGGLIARVAALGLPISVIVLSNGDSSVSDSDPDAPERLAAIRRIDVMNAVAALAPDATLRLLELPDGALSAHVHEASAAIAAELPPGEPGVWIVAPWRADGHPDHIAAGDAAADAARSGKARLFEYPIWAWHWSSPTENVWPDAALRALDLSRGEREAKARALGVHQSHGHELSEAPGDEPIVKPQFSAHFTRGFETFIEADIDENAHDTDVQTAGAASASARRRGESLPAPFFDELYSSQSDPWGVETQWYEKRKRALTLAALPREHFGAVLELGCSTGVLTVELARRCDSLLAVDSADKALATARERLAGHRNVTFEKHVLPAQWPAGTFELIILSEVAYYCSATDLRRLLEKCRANLTPDGVLLACHWRRPVPEYPLTADNVHIQLAHVAGLQRTVQHREKDFLLDVFEPRPARSVAEREGLVS